MSTPDQSAKPDDIDQVSSHVPPKDPGTATGVNVRDMLYESPEHRVDAIEMIGEESAAGYTGHGPHDDISAGMRYLHCSRTIHQLVTDRNRSLGLYLAVATLLWTASAALLNAETGSVDYIVKLDFIKRWCLPVTFLIQTVLAILVAFLMIRTRVGLIYEVAKMNSLLGLPYGRVKRINPLSIAFIMQLVISLAGGMSSALLSIYLFKLSGLSDTASVILALLVGILATAGLVVLYILSVIHITSDQKLVSEVKQNEQPKEGAGQSS